MEVGKASAEAAEAPSRNEPGRSENSLVARNVRRYRQERGLSLGQLARRSGLSKQTLSKIELGAGNPTVETLSQLGAALEVSIRRLMTEWGTPVYLQREGPEVWSGDDNRRERLLDEIYGSGYVRSMVLRLRAGGGAVHPVESHSVGTQHCILVMSGRLRAGPATEPALLGPGDFVRFPADVPHLLECLSERATVHIVTTRPQVRQPPGGRLGAERPGRAGVESGD